MIEQRAGMPRTLMAALMGFLLILGVMATTAPGARADSQPLDAANLGTPTTVSADGLPTVQINGVVWSQVVVGNTVYVAGKFTSARPAGVAAGTQETARNNMLAYDIRTGALITSFAPSLNAQALVVTASPDGSRVYVGGDFTSANGQTRNRVAAYDTATGALVTTFAPSVSGQVKTIAATNSTVYLGGAFGSVGSVARQRLAAVSAANGALLPWAPVPGTGPTDGNRLPDVQDANGNPIPNPKNQQTSNVVNGLVITSGGSQVVAAGAFDSLNGVKSTGVGALDATTGATRPFAINQLITNQGINSSIYSLSTDGTNVYGTAYDYYGPGNLEGSFEATADGGNLVAINDCHGDTYSSYPLGGALYLTGHPHVCSNIGGFPERDPRVSQYATAVSIAPTGTVGGGTLTNGNWVGKPAPSVLPWYPDLAIGSYTGAYQGGWSISGNSQYVVYGGEFPRVNGVAQQGLVRFAMPSVAGNPNKRGPAANDGLTPTVTSLSAGTARVSWQATYDQDNENLVYKVVRNGNTANPVFTTTQASQFWNRPSMGFIDRNLTPGATYTYKVYAYDPFNNSATRGTTSVTVSSDTSGGGLYYDTVLGDSPTHYWRFDGPAGSAKTYDQAGFDDLNLGSGVAQGASGALTGTSNTAAAFNGTSDGTSATPSPVAGPKTFGLEAWFKTTTTSGGKIVGFGDQPTGNSGNYDRHIYMDDNGRVYFGVWLGWGATLETGDGLNDGKWHHVVASDSPSGLTMFMDGQLVGQRSDASGAQDYPGYWRVGGDTAWAGSSSFFNGQIDEVAVYPAPLTSKQVQSHYVVGTTGQPFNEPPQARWEYSPNGGLSGSFDGSMSVDPDSTAPSKAVAGYSWNFGDGTTSTQAQVSHTFPAAGTYRVSLTVTDSRGATGTTSRAIGVSDTGTVGGAYSQAVLGSGAEHYWRLGEPSGPVYDMAGSADLATGSGVTRGAAGAIAGDADKAASFNGTGEGRASTQTPVAGPNVFSIETWFKTTTTSGGKLVGFGNQPSGDSSNYDRHLYMDESGRLSFGVWTGAVSIVQSGSGLNDGNWHYVVGSLSPAGLSLAVDGQVVASRSDITAGQPYNGYWRIGGDSSWAASNYFAGVIDDVAIYPTALSSATIAQHYAAGNSAAPANQPPTATFTGSSTDLHAAFDASSSSDGDGNIVSYAWDFGDGATGTGKTATHDYATGGTYTVTLTVTDDRGASSTSPGTFTITAPPANQPPSAAFTSTANNLAVSFDATKSSDGDGQVVGYAWNFGDGATGTGATTSHTYAGNGTYAVTLTVTDDHGATGTVSHDVTVSAPVGPAVIAKDAFGRVVNGGLGTADVGGAWTVANGGTRQSVNSGVATLNLAAATNLTGSYLGGVSQTGADVLTSLSLSAAPTGGGTSVYVTGRRVGLNQEYRTRVRFAANGQVGLALTRLAGSASEVLIGGEVIVPGLTYAPGTVLNLRVKVAGSGTTSLSASLWVAGASEPTTPTVSRSDTTASLQAAGGLALSAYLSGTATAPVNVRFTSFSATAAN